VSLSLAILGLAMLILVHEAGHFFVARAVGMSPRKFYVGFPPALAKVRRNGIEYGIGAIPLGGYVKIPGMHRPAPSDVDVYFGRAVEEHPELERPVERLKRLLACGEFEAARDQLSALRHELEETELSPLAQRSTTRGLSEVSDALGGDAYWRQRTWKKVAVIIAGPFTNFVLAIVLLAAVYAMGVPVALSSTVDEVLPGTPAAQIGLRPGDRILALNGERVEPEEIAETIRESEGEVIRVTVARDGRRVTLPPARPADTADGPRLGFAIEPLYEHYGIAESIRLATRTSWEVTKDIGATLPQLFVGENRENISSAVGITQVSSQAVEQGARQYLQVLALISLSLALLNLLPLLPLDGGHIAFSLVEGIRGRAIGRAVYERASVIGLVFVLFLFVIGLSNDVERLRGG
jgi:regulator of sigma E protease